MAIPENLTSVLSNASALIFDMDGTLIDSMPLHFDAWKAVADRYGLPFSSGRFYELGGVPTYETLVILSNEAGITIDLMEAKLMKESLYRSMYKKAAPLQPTLSIVEHFYQRIPLAIATGSSREGAQRVLGHLNLINYFDAVVTSDDVSNHKPAPDVFIEAANQLGVLPEQCVAFEDTDIGIQAIESANMIAIDVRTFLG